MSSSPLPPVPPSPAAEQRRPRGLLEVFVTFSVLALQGFGGVLAVAQRELVERKQWLTREDFLDAYSLAQLLPGPNVVNLSLMLGDRFFGWRGALAAIGGMILTPLLIALALVASYNQFAEEPVIAGMLRGMGAVAAGLMMAMGIKLIGGLRPNALGPLLCALLALATVAGMAVWRLPLAPVVIGLGCLGWLLAYWRIRRRAA